MGPKSANKSNETQPAALKPGDVIWVRYRRWPKWPALVKNVNNKKINVYFLPDSRKKGGKLLAFKTNFKAATEFKADDPLPSDADNELKEAYAEAQTFLRGEITFASFCAASKSTSETEISPSTSNHDEEEEQDEIDDPPATKKARISTDESDAKPKAPPSPKKAPKATPAVSAAASAALKTKPTLVLVTNDESGLLWPAECVSSTGKKAKIRRFGRDDVAPVDIEAKYIQPTDYDEVDGLIKESETQGNKLHVKALVQCQEAFEQPETTGNKKSAAVNPPEVDLPRKAPAGDSGKRGNGHKRAAASKATVDEKPVKKEVEKPAGVKISDDAGKPVPGKKTDEKLAAPGKKDEEKPAVAAKKPTAAKKAAAEKKESKAAAADKQAPTNSSAAAAAAGRKISVLNGPTLPDPAISSSQNSVFKYMVSEEAHEHMKSIWMNEVESSRLADYARGTEPNDAYLAFACADYLEFRELEILVDEIHKWIALQPRVKSMSLLAEFHYISKVVIPEVCIFAIGVTEDVSLEEAEAIYTKKVAVHQAQHRQHEAALSGMPTTVDAASVAAAVSQLSQPPIEKRNERFEELLRAVSIERSTANC